MAVLTRLRRTALVTALALLAPLLAGVTAGPAAASPTPVLAWAPCADARGFECATAHLPLDYDHPRGATISVALARLPASDPAHRIGSIFLNPGGPGGSGVDLVEFAGPFLFSDEVRAHFDLVGFDPRGIARSTPLICFDTPEEAVATLPPFPFPVTRAEERVQAHADRAVAAACAGKGGAILDHMATADVARDMDRLRQAVGDRRITYWGVSYGSFLGQVYANLFPGRVRALVIDGVLDPIAWTTGRDDQARTLPFSTRLRSDQGAYRTLQQFFALCDRGGPNCAFSAGDPARRYARLAKRLLAHPAQLPDGQGGTFMVTYADLVAFTLGALYDPSVWPDFAEALEQLDELTRPQAAAAAVRTLRTRLGAFQPQQTFEGGPGVFCSDSDNPSRFAAWQRAARDADRRFPYFGRIWTWVSSICLPWPGEDADRYVGPFDRRTANPVLVVGNTFDPATRYQGAVTAARLLPRSRLLTLAGWGHTSIFKSACIDGFVNDYLLTTALPPPGTVCRPDVVPFAGPPALALTAAGASRAALVVPPLLRRAAAGP